MSHQHELKPTALPRAGDILLGRYVVEGVLTRGGFAAIYRGRQLGVDRTVAIKCLDPDSIHLDPAAPERFAREAKMVSGLVHPNTITIFDYGRTQRGILFLVMEYIEGVSLNRVLRYGRIDPDRAAHLIIQALHSLREAHGKGIIHRDLKPANVMVCDRAGEQDVVKVLDFGIAKAVGDQPGSRDLTAELTGSDRVIGTPRYMAPEQLAGEAVSPATDLYSVGLILWEMLVGRPAIEKSSSLENMTAQLSDNPIPIPAEVPPRYRAVLRRAVSKDGGSRFQSADDFIEALESARSQPDVGSQSGSSRPLMRVSREVAEARTVSAPRDLVDELGPRGSSVVAPPVPMEPSGAFRRVGYDPNAPSAGRSRLLLLFNVLLAVLLVAVGVTLGVVIVTQVMDRSTRVEAIAEPVATAPPEAPPSSYAVPGGGVLASSTEAMPIPGSSLMAERGAASGTSVAAPRLEVQAAKMQVLDALLQAANTADPLVFVFEGDPADADVFIGPSRIGNTGEPMTIPRQRLPAEFEVARQDYRSAYLWVTEAETGTIAYTLDREDGRGRSRDGRGRSRDGRSSRPQRHSSEATEEPRDARVESALIPTAAPSRERSSERESAGRDPLREDRRTPRRERPSTADETDEAEEPSSPVFQIGLIDEPTGGVRSDEAGDTSSRDDPSRRRDREEREDEYEGEDADDEAPPAALTPL